MHDRKTKIGAMLAQALLAFGGRPTVMRQAASPGKTAPSSPRGRKRAKGRMRQFAKGAVPMKLLRAKSLADLRRSNGYFNGRTKDEQAVAIDAAMVKRAWRCARNLVHPVGVGR